MKYLLFSDIHGCLPALEKVLDFFEQEKSIYFGVYLIHDLSEKTQDAIVSYGERLSSKIVATLIRGAKWFDSRKFIKTERINGKGKHTLDSELTCKLVKETFAELPRISLVPGFISLQGCHHRCRICRLPPLRP